MPIHELHSFRFIPENPKRNKRRRLGWHAHRDERSYAPEHHVRSIPEVAEAVADNRAPVSTRWGRTVRPLNQGNLGSCHDAQTEVLTADGWRLFADLDGSESLASVDPATARLVFEVPTRLVAHPFKGDLVVGRKRTVDFRVTPDHTMLVRRWDEKARTLAEGFTTVDAEDIGWYAGLLNRVRWDGTQDAAEVFALPGVPDHKHKPQREAKVMPMALWLSFLGIYLAEGTIIRNGSKAYKIQLAASKEREKSFIRNLLVEMGQHFLELGDRFTFESRQVCEQMGAYGLTGVHAPDKFVPAFVFQQSASNIAAFLRGHFMGDGSEQSGHRSHYTSSVQLADDLQRLIFLSGNESFIAEREPRTSTTVDGREIVGRYPGFRVSVCEKKNLSLERSNDITREPYDGMVYCAEVPTFHTLVTRRNGRILVSGNCTGNAVAGLLATSPFNHDGVRDDVKVCEDLAVAIYSRASGVDAIDGQYPPKDTGSTGLAALKAAKLMGLIESYKWCHTFEDVLLTLQRGPVVFGVDWYAGFDTPDKNGRVKLSGKVEGGHEFEVLGLDVENELFEAVNSWGSSWGKKGRFFLPFSVVQKLMATGGEVATAVVPETL